MKLVFAYCLLALFTILGAAAVFAVLTRERTVGTGVVARVANRTEPSGSHIRRMMPQAVWSYQGAVQQRIRSVDKYTLSKNPFSRRFHRLVTKFDESVGNRVARNGREPIVRLDNGAYTYIFPYRDASGTWTNIVQFAAWLQTKNIRCVHLLPPYKFDDRKTVFPEGIPHGYGRMVAEYRQFMSAHRVPCYDAQEFLMAANPDFHSWFYQTYLHYKAHAGLTIARETARKLVDELGIAAAWEALREDGFTRSVGPGSSREVFQFGGDDADEDLEVYCPRNDGRFHIEIPSLGLDRTGGFHDTLIDQERLNPAHYGHAPFLHGFQSLIRVENLTCANHTRVLVIRRCDASVTCAYLAGAVRYLDVVSPYSFNGSIRKFIEETRPDVVMFCTYMQTSEGDSFWKLQ